MEPHSKLLLMTTILLIAFLLVIILPPQQSAFAAVIYYVAPGGIDTNDCLSLAMACATITNAIGKTTYGDTVIVMPGTYSDATGETFPINLTPGIHLLGSGRDSTIVSGLGGVAVILFGEGSDFTSDTSIQDMTLQNGDFGLEFVTTGVQTNSPSITGLSLRANGVGIQMITGEMGVYGGTISPIISDTQVISNTYTGIIMMAVSMDSPSIISPTIRNTSVEGNGLYGIHMSSYGEGNNTATVAPHIIYTHVIDNGMDGVHAVSTQSGLANPIIEQSWIEDNVGYGLFTGRDPNSNINVAITNTVIASNQAGGVHIYDRSDNPQGSLRIINSNIQYNLHYGINWDSTSPIGSFVPLIGNTILWNSSGDDLYSTGAVWTTNEVRYSDIEDGDFNGQSGNFSADPLFWDTYHLSSCSPAIDAGTTSDMPQVDIDGDPRPLGIAPDVGVDEQDAPCLISLNKQVSSAKAHLGDTLSYTITLSATEVITPINLIITDTLPQSLAVEPASLWASEGEITYSNNRINWAGTIFPTLPIQLGFAADVIANNTVVNNYALVDGGSFGKYHTPYASTILPIEKSYLAFVNRSIPPRGIYGTVTDESSPAWGVRIDLRFFDGSNWSTYATLFTKTDGFYSFTNVPGLNPGQFYYVRFQNDFSYNDRLWTWHTKYIDAYVAGEDYHMGDFDLHDVHLLSPANGQHVSLPTQFQWTTRPNTPSDSYELNLYDPYDGNPYFYTYPPLNYVGTYTLTNLPPGFSPNTLYVWEIWVYSPDGGYGISYNISVVYFNSTSLGALASEQLPPTRLVTDLNDRLWR